MAERGIGRSSVIVASGTLVSRATGFVKAVALAATIGLIGPGADAFALANTLPNVLFAIIAGGILNVTLVPQLVRARTEQRDGGRAYANKLVTLVVVLVGAATLLLTLAAPTVVLVWGGSLPAATKHLAILFAWWCLPQIFWYGIYTVVGEVLNAYRSYGPYTWAPALNNVVALLGLGILALVFATDPQGRMSAEAWTVTQIAILGGSATLGVASQAIVLFPFWRRTGLRFRMDWRWRGVGLSRAGQVAGWTLGVLVLAALGGIVQSQVVGTASGTSASIAMLDTAWIIVLLPHALITMSIAAPYFTRMSEAAAQGIDRRVARDLVESSRRSLLMLTLGQAVLVVCANPIAAVFQPGAPAERAALAGLIVAFAVSLGAYSTAALLVRGLYAVDDPRTAFLVGATQQFLQAMLTIVALVLPDDIRAIGVALGIGVSLFIQLGHAGWSLYGLGGFRLGAVLGEYWRWLLAITPALSGGAGLLSLCGGFSEHGFAVSSILGAVVSVTLVACLMAVLYIAGLWVLHSRDLRGMMVRSRPAPPPRTRTAAPSSRRAAPPGSRRGSAEPARRTSAGPARQESAEPSRRAAPPSSRRAAAASRHIPPRRPR